MQRRKFIEGLFAGSVMVAWTGAGEAKPALPAAPTHARPDANLSPNAAPGPAAEQSVCENAPWQLVAPLQAGDDIGLGWRLVEFSGVDCGAAILTLRSIETGHEARVHLCRHDGNPRGVAHSESVDLILMNRGDGNAFTDEPLGRVLNVLVAVISHNQQRGIVLPETMISHEARLSVYGSRTLL